MLNKLKRSTTRQKVGCVKQSDQVVYETRDPTGEVHSVVSVIKGGKKNE